MKRMDKIARAAERTRNYGMPLTPGMQGHKHTKVYKHPSQWRECIQSGCSTRFTPNEICKQCGTKTVPLNHGD